MNAIHSSGNIYENLGYIVNILWMYSQFKSYSGIYDRKVLHIQNHAVQILQQNF